MFRNSFTYDEHNHLLFMRLERLEHAGQFVTVLVHTLAHIKVCICMSHQGVYMFVCALLSEFVPFRRCHMISLIGLRVSIHIFFFFFFSFFQQAKDMANDSNATFLQEFYTCLSFICEDLFFARFKQNSAFDAAVASGVPRTDAAHSLLDNIFSGAHNDAERSSGISELLDVKIAPGIDGDGAKFLGSASALAERVEQYTGVQAENDVVTLMTKLEEESSTASTEGVDDSQDVKPSSYIDDRLEELLKDKSAGVKKAGLSRKNTPRILSQRLSNRRIPVGSGSQLQSSGRMLGSSGAQQRESGGELANTFLQVSHEYLRLSRVPA